MKVGFQDWWSRMMLSGSQSMTISWRLVSEINEGSQVELGFSKRGIRRPMVVFRGVVRIDAECTERNFPSQEEAERWAYDIGVRRWFLAYHRARPFARRIPISYPGSPSFDVLDDLLRKLAEDVPLGDLAIDLRKQDAPDSVEPP